MRAQDVALKLGIEATPGKYFYGDESSIIFGLQTLAAVRGYVTLLAVYDEELPLVLPHAARLGLIGPNHVLIGTDSVTKAGTHGQPALQALLAGSLRLAVVGEAGGWWWWWVRWV